LEDEVVATELSRDVLRKLARLGAQRRLEELRQEEAAIRAAFPDLARASGAPPAAGRNKRGRNSGRSQAAATAQSAPAAKRAARYKMTAAQKRAVSERMKKYWAARRKAKG
jgi:hypothetical protein